ncbi:uncharacterized protein [Pseudorasbora parva]|uniref:uncharacterized protein n=1 Tax=Pseudorasbora parva TaxID=51549 RepID=UPI00351DCE1F
MELSKLPLVLVLISSIHSEHTEDFPKPTLTVEPQSSVFTVDSVTLRCVVNQTTGWEFLWRKDSNTESTEPATKTINPVKVSDGGEYRCRAGKGGRYTDYSDPVAVTIHERPKPKVTIKPDHVFKGETVTLRCDINAEGVTGWQYNWKKIGSTRIFSELQELTIRSVSESDAGKYSCYGRETEGSRWSHLSDEVTLKISCEAVLSVSPQKWLTEGDSVNLICEVNDTSTGWTFSWFTVTVSSEGGNRYDLLSDSSRGAGGKYTVSSAGLNHTGVYECRAERGKPAYEIWYSNRQLLWVTGKFTQSVSPPVSLIISTSRTQHFTLVSLSLSCEDQSNSDGWTVRRYTDTWGLEDCSSQWGSQTGSKCTIRSTSTSDTGVYWCQSESGEKSHPVNNTVHFGVILESPVHPVTEGDNLTLRCLYQFPSPSILKADFYKDESLIQNQTTEMIIPAVSKSHEGFYYCKHSERGESPKSWISVRGSHSDSQISGLKILSSVIAACPYLLVTVVLQNERQSLFFSQLAQMGKVVENQVPVFENLLPRGAEDQPVIEIQSEFKMRTPSCLSSTRSASTTFVKTRGDRASPNGRMAYWYARPSKATVDRLGGPTGHLRASAQVKAAAAAEREGQERGLYGQRTEAPVLAAKWKEQQAAGTSTELQAGRHQTHSPDFTISEWSMCLTMYSPLQVASNGLGLGHHSTPRTGYVRYSPQVNFPEALSSSRRHHQPPLTLESSGQGQPPSLRFGFFSNAELVVPATLGLRHRMEDPVSLWDEASPGRGMGCKVAVSSQLGQSWQWTLSRRPQQASLRDSPSLRSGLRRTLPVCSPSAGCLSRGEFPEALFFNRQGGPTETSRIVTPGKYYCYRTETEGSRRSNISDEVRLRVSVPIAVLSVSPQKWLTEGDSVNLICEVHYASTGWTFSWFTVTVSSESRNRYDLSDSSRGAGGKYTVSSAGLNHTGVYGCKAERRKPAYEIRYSNTQLLWVAGVSPPVSLIINTNRSQHFTLVSLSLSCEDQSNSDGWTVRRYTDIWGLEYCSSQWGLKTGSKCTIRSTSTSDTGVYWCQSESGEKSHPVNITVHSGVILESPVQPVTEGDNLTLRCLYQFPSPSILKADFYKDESLIQNQTTEMIIPAVSKSHEGFYYCKHSKRGESPKSWISVRGERKNYKHTSKSDGLNPMIIGVTSGLAAVFFIIVFLVLLWCYRNNKVNSRTQVRHQSRSRLKPDTTRRSPVSLYPFINTHKSSQAIKDT